jgi:hypothetical protein
MVKLSCNRPWRPMSCEISRLPYFLDNRLPDGGKYYLKIQASKGQIIMNQTGDELDMSPPPDCEKNQNLKNKVKVTPVLN